MQNRAASDEFRIQLRLATYTTPEAHPQDLPACRDRERFLDAAAERMWSMAFLAGVQWAESQAFVWNFPRKEEL